MFYRSETDPTDKDISIENLDGAKLVGEIKELANRVLRDDKRKDSPFDRESFVIAVHGDWGAGKTTAALALRNHLRDQDENGMTVVLQTFNLLPFGNINESLSSMLKMIADELWIRKLLDVRKEFKTMLIDATPVYDISTGFSAFGLFKLNHRITRSKTKKDYERSLRSKFTYLRKKGRKIKIIIMIDDLDRMNPEEVVIIIRVIEGFKKIPGIIFLIPFNRNIVVSSVRQFLKIEEFEARVYLRKFIKSSITIHLGLKDLRYSFIDAFKASITMDRRSMVWKRIYGFNPENLSWYIFLHIALIEELVTIMRNTQTATSLDDILASQSDYMSSLLKYFANDPDENSRYYPVAIYDHGRAWQPIRGMLPHIEELVSHNMLTGLGELNERGVMEKYTQSLLTLQSAMELGKRVCLKTVSLSSGQECDCDKGELKNTTPCCRGWFCLR